MTSAAEDSRGSANRGSGGGLSGRARLALPLCILALAALSVHRLYCAAPETPYYEFSGATMGTTYSVKLAEQDLDAEAQTRIASEIERRLEEVEALMSTWRPESELSRFNRHRSTEPFAASPQTLAVFRSAREVSDLSGGAFDVTVAPLVAAWGFGATDRLPEPPADEELAVLRERVGYWKIELDEVAGTLRKTEPDVTCDLSAIAKGHGVDRVSEGLVALGYESFLVEVGGELRARGHKRDGQSWRVAIERPKRPPCGPSMKSSSCATWRSPPRATTATTTRSTANASPIPSIRAGACPSATRSPR